MALCVSLRNLVTISQDEARRRADVGMILISRHVETDSPAYSWMNGKFFIEQSSLSSDDMSVAFTIYEVTSSSAPGSS